ncbi:MAG: GNAT family N-acetyltransferase [Firmicutes bacterium]|nr:GNAT family N-acetyltransferase [Bacillota bacterium]
MSDILIRYANENECPLVLDFIKGIAKYEKMSDQVEATVESLYEAIFVKKDCKVLIAFKLDVPIGFALFFYNFSTFKGRKGLYLEDLFIYPEYRGYSYGKQLITHLIHIAKQENCGRMEWVCLDWNQNAIDFYVKLEAKPLTEWTIFRLDEEKFK